MVAPNDYSFNSIRLLHQLSATRDFALTACNRRRDREYGQTRPKSFMYRDGNCKKLQLQIPPSRRRSKCIRSCDLSMMFICAMPLIMMFVLHEEILVAAVDGEGDSCNAQSWEGAFETIESGERPCVSPFIPKQWLISLNPRYILVCNYLPHIRRHGSFVVEPEAAASLRTSKPVRFGRGGAMALRRQVSQGFTFQTK
ncbi:MAG: hypothetical protein Q9228_007498 [Teloschistes exilis]